MKNHENLRRGSLLGAIIIMASLGTVGCGADRTDASADSDEVTNTATLLAKVEVPERGFVKFYEASEGVILVQEDALIGAEPLIPRDQRSVDSISLYRQLAGNDAPAALTHAVAEAKRLQASPRPVRDRVRLDVAPRSSVATNVSQAAEGISKATSAVTFQNPYDEWFFTTYCPQPSMLWPVAYNWMFSTGSGNFTWYDVNVVTSTVSIYGGTILQFGMRTRTWDTWTTTPSEPVMQSYARTWRADNASTDFDAKAWVDQANGDSYHWCSLGY